MFGQTFIFSAPTDSGGRFDSSQAIASPLSIDVKITATLQSPGGVAVHSRFEIRPAGAEPARQIEFTCHAGEPVDLGKWRVVAGEQANLATAKGNTEPAAANSEVVVKFVAEPSFF